MAAAAGPILELEGIGKSFGGVVALDGVDFALAEGEVHGLIGENGAGKSTLMKIISGVHTDYTGIMRLGGAPVRFRSARDALAAGIGMVHQELSIVPSLSVAENVFLGVQPVGRLGIVRWRAMAAEAREHLERLGIDVDPAAEAGALPLGLQQLVEISRVLFSGARIIILDEPTSALSPPEIERLFAVLRRLKEAGTSFVFISHFIDDVLAVSDRVTVFRNARRIATVPAAEVDKRWLIERMIGRGHAGLEESYTGEIELASDPNAPAVMEAARLARRGLYQDVSFTVRAGEVLGIYGFMGSGQLELARALGGKLGTGERRGADRRPAGAARQHLGRQARGRRAAAREPPQHAVRPRAGLQERLDQHPRADRRPAAQAARGAPARECAGRAPAHPAGLGRARAAHALGR